MTDIDRMPRGGPQASWLDRLLQTDRPEYLDRADVDAGVKHQVVRALDLTGQWFGHHDRFAHIALDEIADVPDPRILELGSGHGQLSARLAEMHPTATLTVTDVEPDSVAAIAESELAADPRVTVREMDATAIDADEGSYDLAVFALSFHHLPPAQAARVLAEGTRVAGKFVIIDLPRPPAPLHLIQLAAMAPLAPFIPFIHDGLISSLRAYSPAALHALATHAGVHIELRGGLFEPQVVIATRGTLES